MCWNYTVQKQTWNYRNGRRKKREVEKSFSFFCVFLLYFLTDLCVGIGYVAWEAAGCECFAGSVLPGAGEGIVCADEAEIYAGSEGGKPAAAIEHGVHISHLAGIKRRQIQACQPAAALEHAVHTCHLASIKFRQIQTCQPAATREQVSHTCHLAGIQRA